MPPAQPPPPPPPSAEPNADTLTNDIMASVQQCMAGLEVIDSRANAARLASLRSQVRARIATAHPAGTRGLRRTHAPRLPSWMLLGFAVSLLGGLMGFVGAAKSYEVAATQQHTAERLDALASSGALDRVERVGTQLGSTEAVDRINELDAFRLRAAQAIRDLAELQETTTRLRKFE